MKKLDLRKELKHLYAPSAREVTVVEVPELLFTMIDGTIDVGDSPAQSADFAGAMGALYRVGCTLKFMSKLRPEKPLDFTVMAAEGLWWTDSGKFDLTRNELWHFTLMMLQPDHVSMDMFGEAVAEADHRRSHPALHKMRLERFDEGLCMQIMHIGPYGEEPGTISRMESFATENDYRRRGKHHEIYLGDPRRARPENLKTILRHPIEAAD